MGITGVAGVTGVTGPHISSTRDLRHQKKVTVLSIEYVRLWSIFAKFKKRAQRKQDLNPEPSAWEEGVLTTMLRRLLLTSFLF